MIKNYFYDGQLRSYILQFTAIFEGLQVKTGKGECDEQQFISVPCVVGNKDRVVAALFAGNTHNRVFSLPTMSVYLSSISPAPERRKVQAYVDQRVTMKTGGIFPDDLTVVKRAMPIPYNTTVELSIWASNTQQMHQILEQILVLFNPDIQIQKSDAPFDWTKLTKVELTDISNEENYPSSQSPRTIVWTLTFEMPIFLSIPMGVKDDVVRRVIIQLGSLDTMSINEVDENGELVPFGTPIAKLDFDSTPVPSPTECTYNQTSTPMATSIDETWFNPNNSKIKRWDGLGWQVLEQYVPPTVGPDTFPPAQLP
jgi:T4-like virus Myoviridae tail sheath stabiliser